MQLIIICSYMWSFIKSNKAATCYFTQIYSGEGPVQCPMAIMTAEGKKGLRPLHQPLSLLSVECANR